MNAPPCLGCLFLPSLFEIDQVGPSDLLPYGDEDLGPSRGDGSAGASSGSRCGGIRGDVLGVIRVGREELVTRRRTREPGGGIGFYLGHRERGRKKRGGLAVLELDGAHIWLAVVDRGRCQSAEGADR